MEPAAFADGLHLVGGKRGVEGISKIFPEQTQDGVAMRETGRLQAEWDLRLE